MGQDSSKEQADETNRIIKLGMTIGAVLCLLAGLAMGAMALAGPIAVWLGAADFRMGFGLLQIVNAWSPWIAGITMALAAGIFMLGMVREIEGAPRLATFAFLGAFAAGLAWLIPASFRPPEGTPVIHDVATDPDNPLSYIAIAPLRADAPNNMDYGVMRNRDITVEQHRKEQREAYPDIVPQRFDAPVGEVFGRALSAARRLGWEIVDQDPDSGRIEATDTTFWFRFKDDVVIQVTSEGSGSVLNARSLSRVGTSDVGKNAARLREFFALL